MKSRNTPRGGTTSGSELKGVVKKTAGRLTGNKAWEEQGEAEMNEGSAPGKKKNRRSENPDPHRRG